MSLTLVLALWGAAVSTLLGALRVVEFRRQRPRIALVPDWNVGSQGVYAGVRVINRPGGLTTTITQAGYELTGEVDMEALEPEASPFGNEPEHARGIVMYPLAEGVFVLEPGRQEGFYVALPEPWPFLDEETQVRPYAVDIEGRRHVGEAVRLLGVMSARGWRPHQLPEDAPTLPHIRIAYTWPPEVSGLIARLDDWQDDDGEPPSIGNA